MSLAVREGGSHGRIIGYRQEAEWDSTEREWMLALEEYEANLCPLCGLPTSFCHDPQRERDVKATPGRCWVTDERMRVIDELDSQPNPPKRQGAQTTSISFA